MYKTLLHQMRTAPWDGQAQLGHDHCQRVAARIALDIVARDRWDEEPAYDGTDGHYVGDASDDRVRCNSEWVVFRSLRQVARTDEQVTEHAYRALYPTAALWLDLCSEIRALVKSGHISRDEDVEAAASRLTANGYTPQSLRAEVGAR